MFNRYIVFFDPNILYHIGNQKKNNIYQKIQKSLLNSIVQDYEDDKRSIEYILNAISHTIRLFNFFFLNI